MRPAKIAERRQRDAVKFDAAEKIRAVLDEARAAFGADDWDADDIETAVLELVTDEDPS